MKPARFTPEAACSHGARIPIASAEDVASEIELRRDFFRSRLEGPIDAGHLRDLTAMTTDDAARIDWCPCDLLIRDDSVRTAVRFADDHYDTPVLEMLHALHVDVFSAKTDIRDRLPEGTRVLEIGSYAGGFLEAARRWGWSAAGIDIGRDTAAFTRRKGYDVTTERFERCDFPRSSFDGVFIWNCFEQMPDPAAVLQRAFAIVRAGGLLVIEVPDGAVYREAQRAFSNGEPRVAASRTVHQLAYNNLLGFPHRFGYSETSLTRLVTASGFVRRRLRRVPAIRPMRDLLTPEAVEEERRVAPAWIEAVFERP